MEYYTWNGIGYKIYRLAHLDAVHLGFTIVGYYPYIVIIHDACQHLSWLNQLSLVDIFPAHHAVAGSHDYGIRKVQTSQIELRLSHTLAGTRTAQLLGLYVANRGGTCLPAACLLITSLGSQIAGVGIIILLAGYRILLHQGCKTVKILLGVHHVYTCLFDTCRSRLHVGSGGSHAGRYN